MSASRVVWTKKKVSRVALSKNRRLLKAGGGTAGGGGQSSERKLDRFEIGNHGVYPHLLSRCNCSRPVISPFVKPCGG